MTWAAGTATYSAYPPPASKAQTRCPTAHPVTPSPTSAIVPDTSKPRISLAPGGGGYLPAACSRSARFTPAAPTLISTSPARRRDVGDFLPGQLVGGFGHDRAHEVTVLACGTSVDSRPVAMLACFTIAGMEGIIAGRTASDMPGLDIAEQRSWQNFLDSALRMYATLNRALVDAHHLTLNDVRLLDMLDKSATGSARMGDLAEGLMSLPSRVTRQIRRLELQGLVRRGASPDDGRGVLASSPTRARRGERGDG